MSAARIIIEDADGNEIALPAIFRVCPRCEGAGSHVNPSIDGNGLTAEDFAEDPDFAEEYMRGSYDVPCQQCGGQRVIEAVDASRFTAEQRAAWEAHQEAEREYRRDYNSERWLRYAETGVLG